MSWLLFCAWNIAGCTKDNIQQDSTVLTHSLLEKKETEDRYHLNLTPACPWGAVPGCSSVPGTPWVCSKDIMRQDGTHFHTYSLLQNNKIKTDIHLMVLMTDITRVSQ